MNQRVDFAPNLHEYIIGTIIRNDYSLVSLTLLSSHWMIYCLSAHTLHLSHLYSEPVGGYPRNLHRYIIGTVLRDDQVLVTLTIFSRSVHPSTRFVDPSLKPHHSHEPMGGFPPNLHEYISGTIIRTDYSLVTLTVFSRSLDDWLSIYPYITSIPLVPVGGYPRNLHKYIIGTILRDNKVLVTLTLFSRSKVDFEYLIFLDNVVRPNFLQACLYIMLGHG